MKSDEKNVTVESQRVGDIAVPWRITKPKAAKPPPSAHLLTVPTMAGRAIVESGAVMTCRLLGTDSFVKFCRKCGLQIDRERLIRLERLGLFAPIFRVRTPKDAADPFHIPVRKGNNWFTKGWAHDTTGIPQYHDVPEHTDPMREGYYSIFQIDYLHCVLTELTPSIPLDSYIDQEVSSPTYWQSEGEKWMDYALKCAENLREGEFRRAVALLCQHISNRYFPQTQSDQRILHIKGGFSGDQWVMVHPQGWDWRQEAQNWDPKKAEKLYNLTPEKLRHVYETLAFAQAHCDPIEQWYQLVQFISPAQRQNLKGDALRAETLRAGAYMIRLLHKDLYGEELPHPNEVHSIIRTPLPELEVRRDVRRYLEFVSNRFGVNPQPRFALIVEGQSEESAVTQIFEGFFGSHPGVYSIEIIALRGVGNATGNKKEDRFRAILRLIDYLHHHQTITFLVLDNENYATRLKQEAKRAQSIHGVKRYVTRPDYIRIWHDSFEFDNFSCTEIACALNELAQGHATFTVQDVTKAKSQSAPGSELTKLYRGQTNRQLPKVKLSEILVRIMLSPSTRRKVENRPIVKILTRVRRLAVRNPLPSTQWLWEANQSSSFLGKRIWS